MKGRATREEGGEEEEELHLRMPIEWDRSCARLTAAEKADAVVVVEAAEQERV